MLKLADKHTGEKAKNNPLFKKSTKFSMKGKKRLIRLILT